ncbi:carboxypeptidase M32 [Clostridium sp. 19966]|uniref:carboxypeptidase M32 n=1 Tax=Clostridium sp. 19966 TaxID=2768166 RepID=UPI0028DE938B|nr:carboxypeptidase M32 [Clostridium sp. 19966]MDT8719053.1 carboxypeptidase M32 [Clostridium sp. 19966]
MELQAKIEEFKNYLKSMEDLRGSIALLDWDARVNMPKKGIEGRSDAIAYLSGEYFKMETSDKMREFVEYFEAQEGLDHITKAAVKNCRKNYDLSKKIPESRYIEFVKASSISGAAWEEAKEKSDFSIFQPHLQKMVDFKKEFVEYWGYEEDKYDTLLDIYEPGITVKKLDEVFGELKNELVDMLKKIARSSVKVSSECFKKSFPKKEQEEFSIFLLNKMEFDFNAGRLDESVHPFTTNFSNKDVRITSHYYENEFRSALFSAVHEGGHAIYEQDIPDSLRGTLLGTGASMGIHESQSRFYENIIGRSQHFWKYFYSEAIKRFSQFEEVSFEEFYKGINEVLPSLIRTEADELSYSIHVIIRYEIEKDLINGRVKVQDLPKVWNAKYKEYLGVEPSNDAEGVLQDVHWSDGSFGYFPSYALGNLYGAQFLNKLTKDIPNIFKDIEAGNLSTLHTWLKDNIHCYGAVYEPQELIKKVTGEELKAKYFIDYLKEKYGKIYNF